MESVFSNISIDQAFPLLAVKDGWLVSRRGELTLGFRLRLPICYTLGAERYDEIGSALHSALRQLPPYTIVHKQDRYYRRTLGSALPSKISASSGANGIFEDASMKLGSSTEVPDATSQGFLAESFNKHFNGREYLSHDCLLFLTFSNPQNINSQGGSSLRGSVFSHPLPSSSELHLLAAKASEFISVLTGSALISAEPLFDTDYLGSDCTAGLLSIYMKLGEVSPIQYDIQMHRDSIDINGKKAEAFVVCDSAMLPDSIQCAHKVEALSSALSSVYLSTGAQLCQLLPIEHTVNQYWVTIPQSEVKSKLQGKSNRMMSMSRRDSANRVNASEIESYLADSAAGAFLTTLGHLNIIFWGEAQHLSAISGRVSAALSMLDMSASKAAFDMPVLFWSGIPGAGSELGKANLLRQETRSSICLSNFDSYPRGFSEGTLRLCDRSRHIPLRLDLQSSAYKQGLINNYNAFVVGGSGSGKSFFVNVLLQQGYDNGEEAFIIDVGDSYEGLCEVIAEESSHKDGLYLSWDSDHPISFCPFEGYEGWLNEDGEGIRTDESGYQFILSFLQTAWTPDGGGWTTERKRILESIVYAFVHSLSSLPLFDDFYRYLEHTVRPRICYKSSYQTKINALTTRFENGSISEAKYDKSLAELVAKREEDLRSRGWDCSGVVIDKSIFDIDAFLLSLQNYAKGGNYGFLLNDPHPRDLFSSRFTVCEVDKLSSDDPKFYSLCILCIVNAFDKKMRSGSASLRRLVIDEAWKAIANDTMAPYLASLFRTARKYNAGAMVISQSVGDIVSSELVRKAIIDNSSIKILLDQSNNIGSFDDASSYLGLTQSDKSLVLSINRESGARSFGREVFIKWGEALSGVYSVEVSAAQALAFESNKSKKAPLLALAQSLSASSPAPLIDAIKQTLCQP